MTFIFLELHNNDNNGTIETSRVGCCDMGAFTKCRISTKPLDSLINCHGAILFFNYFFCIFS